MYIMLDINHQEDRSVCILAEDLVDLNIVSLEGIARGVPAHKFLLVADLNEGRGTFRIMSNMASWKRWSRNQMLD